MYFRLIPAHTNSLLKQPESGMGYQIVEIENMYSILTGIVFNSELFVQLPISKKNDKMLSESLTVEFYQFIKKVKTEGFESVLNSTQTSNYGLPKRIVFSHVLFDPTLNCDQIITKHFRSKDKNAAIDSELELLKENECFSRLTPFLNDKRIDFENKRYMAGTFATTTKDYLTCLLTKDNPIDRYALPSDLPLKYAFHCAPKVSNDKLQRGTVQPAFNHCGGGIEAFFKDGTSNNTLITITKFEMDKNLKLKDTLREYLTSVPESGMGYQMVNIILSDGAKLTNRIILNGEYLVLGNEEELSNEKIKSLEIISIK